MCNYWYFLDKNFKCGYYSIEPYLYNGGRDFMEQAVNFDNIPTVSVKRNDYGMHFFYMSKDEVINIMKNCGLNQKTRSIFS